MYVLTNDIIDQLKAKKELFGECPFSGIVFPNQDCPVCMANFNGMHVIRPAPAVCPHPANPCYAKNHPHAPWKKKGGKLFYKGVMYE